MKGAYDSSESLAQLTKELSIQVRKVIGPFAAPRKIYIVTSVPKTRSGKIMRRLLRKIASGDDSLGDTSSLEDPNVLENIKQVVAANK